MVSRVKTDMPCCYQHKTLNITGNGTKTVLESGRSRSRTEREAIGSKWQSVGESPRVSKKLSAAKAPKPTEIR